MAQTAATENGGYPDFARELINRTHHQHNEIAVHLRNGNLEVSGDKLIQLLNSIADVLIGYDACVREVERKEQVILFRRKRRRRRGKISCKNKATKCKPLLRPSLTPQTRVT